MPRLTDEEYARHAAKHALYPDGNTYRPERIEDLKSQGVTDEKSLGDHALKVMNANDTKCFRGHEGRECYGNDRLNTIVRTNEKNPELSTIHHNDDPTRTATQRVEDSAKTEGARNNTSYQIRTGGSQALEQDRPAASQSQSQSAGQPSTPTVPVSTESGNPYQRTSSQEQKPEQPKPETQDNPYKRTPPGGSGQKH